LSGVCRQQIVRVATAAPKNPLLYNPKPPEHPTTTPAPKTASPTGPGWCASPKKEKLSCIFFADAYGELEVYQGKADAQYKGGNHVAKIVGFGVTRSTSYVPFIGV
jgi:hypothetical protein